MNPGGLREPADRNSRVSPGLSFPRGSVVNNPPANTGDAEDSCLIPGSGDPPEKEMATYSRILAWEIPWTEQAGGLQSMTGKESDMTEHACMQALVWKRQLTPTCYFCPPNPT